ncbi:hypothetical protein LWI29_029900 [Acer saccharum]|uniref:Uncharacterized protein n=1 Tax=Acer saccharum TaxID=4024 RepID=A0AA39W2S5_ACESA|nr:hypothetical protein LWI29_029900 [Acer saccharum]
MADHVERDVICYGWLTSDARLILFMSGLVGDCVLEVSTQCKALSKFMQTTKLRKDLISSSNQALPSLQRIGAVNMGSQGLDDEKQMGFEKGLDMQDVMNRAEKVPVYCKLQQRCKFQSVLL